MKVILTLSVVFLLAGCGEYTHLDPKDRPQRVFHYICGEESFYLYYPVETLGVSYTESGYKVASIPEGCSYFEMGIVDNIGDVP